MRKTIKHNHTEFMLLLMKKKKKSHITLQKRVFFIVLHMLLISCARNEAGSKSYLKTAEGLMYRVSELTYLRDMLGTKSPKHA